jgi:hypothetical protein
MQSEKLFTPCPSANDKHNCYVLKEEEEEGKNVFFLSSSQ